MQSELKSRVNVLLVDDHPENLLALEAILERLDQNLVRANSGEEALRCLLHQDFAVILLDVQMPNMDGFETASLIRCRERSRDTPIIFLTAFSSSDDLMFRGYSLGAVDYLMKPIEPAILLSKVSVFVDLFQKTEAVKRQAAQLNAMNAELRVSEERFRSLSACSPVGVIMTDVQGNCTYTNLSCQLICGFTAEAGLGNGWMRYLHPDDQAWVVADWQHVIRQGEPYSSEFRFQWPDGTVRWVHVRSAPMLSDRGQLIGYVGTIEDISERKQAEQARAQFLQEQLARQQAEAANRMKDEFLGTLSHELRTPLNAMMGWARLLRTRTFDAETTARALETIERNARAQAQLIEDILDVSRIITGKLRLAMRPVSLVNMIESTLEAARPTLEAKSLNLKTNLDPAADYVSGDVDRLTQVLNNLLANAIKFTPEFGQIQVTLEPVDALACITITDTGVGIPADFLPHVFERFRQADSTTTRPHGGLGLGLAIVRHMVELHGGTVQALSEGEGKGASFQIQLPLLQKSESNGHSESNGNRDSSVLSPQPLPLHRDTVSRARLEFAEEPSSSLAGLQILVVEDDLDTCELISIVLGQRGARVLVTTSVREAIQVIEQTPPHIIVSDIGMPGEDGYSLIRKIRAFPDRSIATVPAIALTAYARDEERARALSAGFHAHIAKPLNTNELIDAIAQLAGLVEVPS